MRKLWAALAAVAGVLVYWNALRNPFVYDDAVTVVDNYSIRDLHQLGLVLSYSSRFRPVVSLSYALDHAVWGLDPLGYHLTSVFLHAINVLLLARVIAVATEDQDTRLGRPAGQPLAVAAALLFAVHPLLTQAVGYTAARSELLCTAFSLACLLLARRAVLRRSLASAAAAILVFALALGSKETAAVLPLVFLAYDRLLLPSQPAERRRRLLRLHLPLIGLLIAGAGARAAVYLGIERPEHPSPLHTLMTELGVIWRYLRLFVAPVGQSLIHHVRPVESPFEPVALLALAGIAALIVGAFRIRRAVPLVAFGVSWFLLTIAPSSSLIRLPELMSEHRTYLPSVGCFLIISAALGWPALLPRVRYVVVAAVLVVAGALAAGTVARNRVWSDPAALWKDATQKAPEEWGPHFALATTYGQRGRCDLALDELVAAIEILPRETRAYMNLGICLSMLRQPVEAQQAFEKVLELDPQNAKAHVNLGVLRRNQGQTDEARRSFLKAIALDPGNIPARQHLVNLHSTLLPDPGQVLALCLEIRRIAPLTPGIDDCIRQARAHGAVERRP